VPLEPLFSLEVACELIPLGYHSLTNLLCRHADKFPPRYHLGIEIPEGQGGGSPKRVLYESELIAIREMVISNTRIGVKRPVAGRASRRAVQIIG